MIVPVSGLRRRIRQRKDAELARIARALSGNVQVMASPEVTSARFIRAMAWIDCR